MTLASIAFGFGKALKASTLPDLHPMNVGDTEYTQKFDAYMTRLRAANAGTHENRVMVVATRRISAYMSHRAEMGYDTTPLNALHHVMNYDVDAERPGEYTPPAFLR